MDKNNTVRKRENSYFCPECNSPQEPIPNPAYLHRCSVCRLTYDLRSLRRYKERSAETE